MPATEKPKSKSSKPLMEKRRRARINDSLMQLKSLVLDALNKNNSRHSKLEKADILEMTVRYLRTIQRQQISASANADPAVLGQYRSGYAECVNEVTRYLGTSSTGGIKTTDGGDAPELRTRLVGHLADMCTTKQQTTSVSSSASPQQHSAPMTFQIASQTPPPSDGYTHVNAQPTSVPIQSVSAAPAHPEGARTDCATMQSPVMYNTTVPRGQLSPVAQGAQSPTNSYQMIQNIGVAGSLPSGEITLVLPQQALPNGQLPTHLIPVYAPTAGSATVLSPTPATNCATSTPATTCHVAMSSPRAAATVPPMQSPTAPQSSMTIPAQHALVTHTPSPQVAYRVPIQQTNIQPADHQIRCEPARAHHAIAVSPSASTKTVAWRPW